MTINLNFPMWALYSAALALATVNLCLLLAALPGRGRRGEGGELGARLSSRLGRLKALLYAALAAALWAARAGLGGWGATALLAAAILLEAWSWAGPRRKMLLLAGLLAPPDSGERDFTRTKYLRSRRQYLVLQAGAVVLLACACLAVLRAAG